MPSPWVRFQGNVSAAHRCAAMTPSGLLAEMLALTSAFIVPSSRSVALAEISVAAAISEVALSVVAVAALF